MQNYIFLEKNSELLQKVPVLEDFLSNFTVPFLLLEQKVLPPLGEKSESPPAGPFSTPLLPPTTVPTYATMPKPSQIDFCENMICGFQPDLL